MAYDKARNLELLREYKKTGSRRTLAELTAYNDGLVKKKARAIADKTPSLDFDDAYQQGIIGLLKAIEGFELDRVFVSPIGEVKPIQFSTYAGRVIWGEIMHWVRDRLHPVRTPRAWLDKRRILLELWDSGAPIEEIERMTKIPRHEIPQAVHAVKQLPLTSLDQSATDDGSSLLDCLSAAHSEQIFHSVEDLLMTAQAEVEGDFFNLTKLCREHGKVPANYLILSGTRCKARSLEKIVHTNIFKITRGRGGKVMAHKSIAPHFLLWLNKKTFETVIDQALLANLETLSS